MAGIFEIFEVILRIFVFVLTIYFPGYLVSLISLKNEKDLDFIDKVFIRFLAGFLLIGVAALSLAILKLFSLMNLTLLLVVISSILIFRLRRHVYESLISLKEINIKRNWIKEIGLRYKNEDIYLVIIILISLFLFFKPSHWIVGGSDPGVYVNTGIHIAKSGSIIVHDEFLEKLGNDLKSYFYKIENRESFFQRSKYIGTQFLGFYITNVTSGEVVPQFYYLYPTWIAIFYSFFGLLGSLYATPFISTLSVVAMYLLGKKLFNKKTGLVASILLMFNFSQIWFSRYPNSEILSQFLILSGLFTYAIYISRNSPFFGVLSALCFGEVFLTRIDSYILIIPITIAIIIGQMRVGRTNIFFTLPFLAVYILASGIAFFVSLPYTVYVLKVNLKVLKIIDLKLIQLLIFVVYPIFIVTLTLIANKFKEKLKNINYTIFAIVSIAIYFIILISRYAMNLYFGKATNLYFASIYLAGWIGILIASLGFLLVVKNITERKNPSCTFFVAIFLTGLILWSYLHRVAMPINDFYNRIIFSTLPYFPSRPVWFRYYIPVVVPSFILFSSYFIGKLMTANRKEVRFGSIIILTLILTPSLIQDARIIDYKDYEGSIDVVRDLANELNDSYLAIYREGYVTAKVSLPLYYTYDINIRPLVRFPENFSVLLEYPTPDKKIYFIDFCDTVTSTSCKVYKFSWKTLRYHISWKNHFNYIFIPSKPRTETYILSIEEINLNKEFILPLKHWYGPELWQNTPKRWMSNNATLLIHSPQGNVSILSFKVLSFYRPRTLQIYLNDELIHEQKIPTKFVTVRIPIMLKKGVNTIRFFTPDGCQRPSDIPELKNRGSRCLSFAFQNISLVKLTPVKFIDVGSKPARICLSSGWSGDEKWGNTNITFVWAEGLKSVVLLPLQNKTSLNLTVKCLPFIYDENTTQEMSICFNENFVSKWTLEPGWHEYEVSIPEKFTKSGINRLEFRYKYAESPKEHGMSNDTRELAVAFDWIRIKSVNSQDFFASEKIV